MRYRELRMAWRACVDFVLILDVHGMLHVSAMVEGKQLDTSIKLGQ